MATGWYWSCVLRASTFALKKSRSIPQTFGRAAARSPSARTMATRVGSSPHSTASMAASMSAAHAALPARCAAGGPSACAARKAAMRFAAASIGTPSAAKASDRRT